MKVVEFKSPIKFEILLKVHFEKAILNLLTIDNVYHTIRVSSLFGGVYEKECKNMLYDLKELLAYELTDYLFVVSGLDLIVDSKLQILFDTEDNICFCRVVHEY